MVKKLPTSARDAGSIPGPRKIPQATEWLGQCSTTIEPVLQSPGAQLLTPMHPRVHVPQEQKPLNKKPVHCNEESPQLATTREKPS